MTHHPSFAALVDTARRHLHDADRLAFDELRLTCREKKLFGVRVANNAICRENVWRDELELTVTARWQGRTAGFCLPAAAAGDLAARLRALREQMAEQSPDQEAVLPDVPSGHLTWRGATGEFDEAYSPATLYAALTEAAAAVRAEGSGLTLTGYVEAQGRYAHTLVRCPGRGHHVFELTTADHGLTLSLTVYEQIDGVPGAVGSAQGSVVSGSPAAVAAAIKDAAAEATRNCLANKSPAELAPGDYAVVLSPAAALDIINTTFSYGLFDRRAIDEGRTFLSRHRQELSYPRGLSLRQTLSLPLPDGGVYEDLPLNDRLVACSGLDLIADGQIKDLHTSAYWARQTGQAETFEPHALPVHLGVDGGAAAGCEVLPDTAALIAATERGVYVANTWYLRMVAEMEGVITGMTRDGVYAIADGRITGPVLNMRWHENPLRLLQRVTGITAGQRLLGRSRLSGGGRYPLAAIPALRVEGFHFSSVTKF
jgi:predicted Zn-dependent protease